ncbi:mechanosensitive ion channel family protein [Conexibacter sp. CPCC 206217]|uniref:mechanosensitive ion channel domain-containing protein n=1 Tax=Conexibacter sp. CPCC 206217 TaxID=3064574 RepID=UPI002726F0FB|nr:mechanosensitive ion channel family protein [Conexibacter sp. CPCC 206217]MDO8210671.1 mechanosensitive ion channel family protein [Conexibacter sp. CPCC 206217]
MGSKIKRFRGSRERALERMLQTRSHAWEEVGLARQLGQRAAKRARRQALVLLPLLVAVLVVYSKRGELFGRDWDTAVRVFTVVALVILGWAFARDVGRAIAPDLFRRMDPGTAGTTGFILRLATLAIFTVAALRIAGIRPETLAVGGAFTAVVFGLAAQQTLGNLIAGTVLLSARPFRVGERVRLQAGGLAGQVEGVVSSLGLLYTTLARGEDRIMVPNSVVLSAAVVPLREPAAVDLRARLRRGVKPTTVQAMLADAITVPLRGRPDIGLEEIDGDEVIMRIQATPEHADDGARLADEVLTAMSSVTDEHDIAISHDT